MSFFDALEGGAGLPTDNISFDSGGTDFFADFVFPLTSTATAAPASEVAFDEAEFQRQYRRRRHDDDDDDDESDDDESDDEDRARRARLEANSDEDGSESDSGELPSAGLDVGVEALSLEEGRGFFAEANRLRATDANASVRLYRRAVACGYLPANYNLAAVLLRRAAPVLRRHQQQLNARPSGGDDGNDEEITGALLNAAKLLDDPTTTTTTTTTTTRSVEVIEAEAEAAEAVEQLQLLVEAAAAQLDACAAGGYVGAAEFNLGYCYRHGLGVEPSTVRAVAYYTRSAERAVAAAQSNLGCCYLERCGPFAALQLSEAQQRAVELFRAAAAAGNAHGAHNLGHCLLHGVGVEQDRAAAVRLFAVAAAAGVAVAQHRLACCLERDSGADVEQLLTLYRQAAAGGVAAAQLRLGDAHRLGQLQLAKDLQQSAHYYELAALHGDATAQCRLGNFHRVHMRNFPLAVAWYSKAALQHDVRAQLALAYLYLAGKGLPQNAGRAYRLFRRAAERGGHRVAQYHVGLALLHGRGVERNAGEAYDWLLRSAEQGYTPAAVQVAACCTKGVGTAKALPSALQRYEQACQQGDVVAEFKLGWLYHQGDDGQLAAQPERGMPLLRRAAERGYAPAQVVLGYLSYSHHDRDSSDDDAGDQVPRAVRLYQAAAEQQNRVALFNLGNCYRLGVGVQPDADKAFELYSLSAQRMYKPAAYNLAIGYLHRGDPINAFCWLTRAAALPQSRDNPELDRLVLMQLGLCFRFGRGVRRSPKRARRCFEKAAELGLVDAKIALAWCHASGFGVKRDGDQAILLLEQLAQTSPRACAILRSLLAAPPASSEKHHEHSPAHDAFYKGSEASGAASHRDTGVELGSVSPTASRHSN